MIRRFAKQVFSELGPGYSEAVYHRAMEVLLRKNNIPYETERIVPIKFQNHVIGNMRIDLIVNNEVIVELKAISKINEAAKIQAGNYLHLTGLQSALIVNFPQTQGSEPEILAIGVELLAADFLQ